MMLFVGGKGLHGVEKSLDCRRRSCFPSEVLGLLLLWFDCAAGLGCVFNGK